MMERFQKNNKKPLTILLVLLLTSFLGMSLVPSLQAIEPNFEAKNLAVLSDVIGINTDSYSTSNIAQRDTDFLGSSQKETDMQLVSAQGSLRVTCFYAKDTLKLVYLSDLNGVLSLKQPLNSTVDMAKGLLERYKTYSGVSVYGEFASMLNGIEPNKESTKYSENVKMEVSGFEANRISYKWTYVDSNGVLAEKKNVILIFEGGVFKGFFNNWPLYSIVDSDVKVSAEQATELAIKASERFSYPVTYDNGTEVMVSGFSISPESLGEAKLIYVNSVYQELARGGDPFSLCLAWYVPLGFDRFYPGDVSGMTVILWADTGEVCSMDRVIVDSKFGEAFADQRDETADVQVSDLKVNDFSTQAIGILTVVALIFVSIFASKKLLLSGNIKLSRKFFGTLLCLSFACSVLFVSLPNADAASVTGRSRVYSSFNTPTGYNNTVADTAENTATAEICNFVGNASLNAGYYTSNVYSNTVSTQVVSNAGSDEQNHLGTIVFHAGHFSEQNQAYQDSSGNPIYASNIYPQTGLGRHFFVFLWVCVQAENHTSGTPRAWTHRDNLSQFGFNQSDGLGQCYISFYGFSPMLSEYVPQSGGYYYNFAGVGSPGPCYWFALKFYYYALAEGYSVHDSLDIASGEFFGCDYESTVLNTGYHSWWPGGDMTPVWCEEHQVYHQNPLCNTGYYPRDFNEPFSQHPWNVPLRDANRMRVFGDSNIYLAMPAVTLSSNYGSPTFYFDGNAVGTGNVKILRDTYSVSTSVPSGYTFNRFTYGGSNYYGNPSNIAINNNGYLEAYFAPIPYRYLDVYSGTGGYTSPSAGTYQYIQGQTAYITAYANSGYSFDYWICDGVNVGSSNPIGVSMNIDHYVQPVFYANPPPQYCLSISSDGGGYTSPSSGAYWYDQGTGVEVSATAYSGHQFEYWVLDGNTYTQNPITVTMNSNHNLQAVFSEPPPSYSLYVDAWCVEGFQLYPYIVVDGVGYAGTASVTVSAGYHTISVEDPYYFIMNLSYFSDGYGNGDSRYIGSNTAVTAWYERAYLKSPSLETEFDSQSDGLGGF